MPYARGKRGFKRRHRTRGAGVFKRTKKVIQRVVNKTLKSNLEVKRWMTGNLEVGVSTLSQGAAANWVTPFTSIAQGSNSYNRIGNKIKVIGLQLKNYFHNNTTVPIWARFVVARVVDRASLSTAAAIFSGTNNQEADFGAVTGMNAMMRPFDKSVFKPIYEKVIKLAPNAGEAASAFSRLNRFIKFPRGLIIDYNSSSTGVTATTPYYVFGIFTAEAPEDIGVGSAMEWSYQYTVYYTDA